MELIFGFAMQFIWPILIGLGALLGFVFYGARKKAEGKAAERERARKYGEAAAVEAQRIRERAAAEPISKQREEVSKWER